MNRDIIKMERVTFYAIVLFLFCFFVQLFGFPNKFALLGSFAICAGYLYKERKLRVGISECLLGLGMFFYTLIAGHGLGDMIVITVLPVLFMLSGKYITVDIFSREKKECDLYYILGAFIIGYFIHGFLNSMIYFREGFASSGRIWGDIWGEPLLATHQNIYVLPILALMFPAFLYLRKYKVICIGVILGGVFFIYQSVDSLSRIPVMIWGILMLWELALFILLNRKNKNTVRERRKILIGIGIFFGIAILIIAMNFDAIKNLTFIQRLLLGGGGLIHNIRFRAQLNAVRQLFVYPFGGYQMDLCGLERSHNVWLDIANAGGLIPFFIIVFYTILSVIDLVKFLRNGQIRHELKYVISGLYFSLVLYYMVEPALMANNRFFIPWPYLNGIIIGCNIAVRKNGSESAINQKTIRET